MGKQRAVENIREVNLTNKIKDNLIYCGQFVLMLGHFWGKSILHWVQVQGSHKHFIIVIR